MKSMCKKIQESKDVNIYKRLLTIFGEYSSAFPCTDVSNLFDVLVEEGKKILPKDKRALKILEYLLFCYSAPDVIQKILNIRFADLPVEIKPITKKDDKHEVASWERNGVISDRVKDLVSWKGEGQGKWSDIDGEKVTLIDT